MKKLIILVIVSSLCFLSGCSNNDNNHGLDPEKPVTIHVWHYYNGVLNTEFNSMVKTFNEEVGLKKGIKVVASSLGSINEVNNQVMACLKDENGSTKMPDIFTAYRDLGFDVNKHKAAVDLTKYLDKEEIDYYNKDFIEEGMFDGKLLILPTSKCSELLIINKTDWLPFSKATGTKLAQLETWEGLVKVAKRYYEYTDSLTPALNDGKAFFSRDAFANYMYIGAEQLQEPLFSIKDGKASVTLDKKTIRRLWDHYYIPYIHGYFVNEGKFASDDAKTGDIISYVGSSSSAGYFPKEVTIENQPAYPIEGMYRNVPGFKGGKKAVMQQGAGMIVAKSNEKKEYASTLFLKWFTQTKRNFDFSISLSYLPVSNEAMKESYFEKNIKKQEQPYNENVIKANRQTLKQFNSNKAYVNDAFENSLEVRKILETSMPSLAKKDREDIKLKIRTEGENETLFETYESDEYFNQWFIQFEKQLKDCVNQ
ncbi:MAG: extracellular solute-binding protein [Erysipelotrichaceae bacterium]